MNIINQIIFCSLLVLNDKCSAEPATDQEQHQEMVVMVGTGLLTEDSTTHCVTIITKSLFEGDCCALNVTTDGDNVDSGCVLQVENGRCKVRVCDLRK